MRLYQRMPTEDYSNTSRTARLRQRSSLRGLNKVARALDYDTQLSMNLGGIQEKQKNSSGITYECGVCSTDGCTNCKSAGKSAGNSASVQSCVGTFPANPGSSFTAESICNGNMCTYTGNNVSYPQINAIPGTSIGPTSGNFVIVNCTSNEVTFTVQYSSSQLIGRIQPGTSALTGTTEVVTYSFS